MKRYTVEFMNYKTHVSWVKSFRSLASAIKAAEGITKKTNNVAVGRRFSKGFKYGKIIKRYNQM